MPIAQEWYVDYLNKVITHSSDWVYYSSLSGNFQAGETVTFNSAYTGICVYDNGTDRMNIVYLTDTFVDTHSMSGGTSGATANCDGTGGEMSTWTVDYDNLAGGTFSAGDATVNSEKCYIATDDGVDQCTIVYMNGTPADGEQISQGGVTSDVNGTTELGITNYSSRQLYSFVQDTFDELEQMDDQVPLSAQTPTEFTLINNWFIDDESTKYLNGGAITTSGYNNVIHVLTFDTGYTNAADDDIGGTVTYTGGTPTDTGTLLHYDNTNRKWWVRVSTGDFSNDATVIIIDTGSAGGDDLITASVTGEDLYANIYTLGTIQTTPKPKTYVFQNSTAISEWWDRGDDEAHIDVLIKVREAGTLIDSGDITVFARQYADLYDHFPIDLSSGGRNAVPLATQEDLNNNESGEITVAYSSASGSFTVNRFIRDTTTHSYGEILVDNGTDLLTIGNVIAGDAGSNDFTATNTLQETIDGSANGDTGVNATAGTVTSVVRGYSSVGIYFVNCTIAYTSGGTTEPTLYEGVSQNLGTPDPDSILLNYTTTSGTWAGGTAAGTLTLGNWNSTSFADATALDGTTTGGDFATSSGTETVAKTLNKAFEQGTEYPYNIIVDCATRVISQVYEWFKYVTREDANSTQPSGFNHITMYRVNDGTTAVVEEDGEEYIYAQTTYTPVKASPFGTFAGGKLFAARGVWVENMDSDDRQNFQLIDANNNTRVPPNFITITVNSVTDGDKVTVFRTDTGEIDKDQFTSSNGNTSGVTSFTVQESIPSDTPSSGYVRIVDVSDTSVNREARFAYASWTGSVFTLSGSQALDRTFSAGMDTAYVPYFDEESDNTSVSVTVIYTEVSSQPVLTRVRRYNGLGDSILPFEISGNVNPSSGYTVSAIRTDDTIVTDY